MDQLTEFFIQSGFTQSDAGYFASHFKKKELAKGRLFAEEGKTSRYLAYISKGLFQYYFVKNGSEVTTYVTGSTNFLASLGSFMGQVPSKEYIRALTDAQLWMIHYDALQRLKLESEQFKSFYISVLEHLLVCLDDSRHKLIALNAEERYAALLKEEPVLLQEVPLQYLASILGITPRHLSRIRNSVR